MTGAEILAVIEQAAATSSKNEKQAIVTKGAADAEFCRVLDYAYNPFKTYGIRKLPIGKAHEGFRDFDEQTWQVLDDLIARKLTGTYAILAVEGEIDSLREESAELFRRILRKDLRAGFSESTCNKAKKGLIPEFPYMRCSLPKDVKLETWPWAEGVFSQEKADGMFANIDHEESGNVSIRSRQGTEFPMDKFAAVADEVRARLKPGTQNHGEFLVLRDGVICARQDGNGVLNHVINGGDFAPNERPILMLWDQIPLWCVAPKGECDTPYKTRIYEIVRQLKEVPGEFIKIVPTKVVRSLAEAKIHAAEFMKAGKEGSVVKHPMAIWKDTTSKEQVKIKLEFEVDLEITDINPGEVGTKNEGRAGAFACQTCDGQLKVNVAIKNESMRDDVDANPETWRGKIIAVTANDIMAPSESNEFYSLFLPRMADTFYRLDKTVADDLPRVKAAKHAAIYGQDILKEVA